jgi:hypothetical protein
MGAMPLDILGVIILTATIQSLFGVGVLLFGTPLLLVLGYDFVTTLTTLLPISLAINLLQVGKHYEHIDRAFYRNILLLTIPPVIVCLLLVTRLKLNIGIVVGLFLILVAIKNLAPWVNQLIESLVRYEKSYFVTMGVIHGLTNLGGSLLTALIHGRHYEKDVARVTTAAAYGTFALFQILTLLSSLAPERLPPISSAIYVVGGVGMFFFTERLIYARLDAARYKTVFAGFLFLSGLLLIGKTALAY